MLYFILWAIFLVAIIAAVPIVSMLENRGRETVQTAADDHDEAAGFADDDVAEASEFADGDVVDFGGGDFGGGEDFADDDDFKSFG